MGTILYDFMAMEDLLEKQDRNRQHMGERTIPAPHQDEIDAARKGIRTQAELHGLDMTDLKLLQFLEQQVEVRAQMAAETRWLRNLLNEKLVNSEK